MSEPVKTKSVQNRREVHYANYDELLSDGAAFGFGLLFVKPAPPWWFLPVPSTSRNSHEPLLGIDKWEQYQIQGGYEAFCVQSTWGWAITAAILGLIFSNVVLRKKE